MAALSQLPRRVAEIRVGPSPAPGQTEVVGRRFLEEDFTFRTKRTRASKPNEATVTIHNLTDHTLRYLEQPGLTVQVLAGEVVAGQLFIGEISRRGVTTDWPIPERVTVIKAADGRRVYRDTVFSASYRAGTPVDVVIQELVVASRLRTSVLTPLPGVVLPTPRHFMGAWAPILGELLLPYGLYFTIQGGALSILPEDGPPPPPAGTATVPLISPTSGLIGSPKRTDKGVNFKATLDARLTPGWAVQVQSAFVSGLYRVATAEDSGSRDGRLWETKVQAEVIK